MADGVVWVCVAVGECAGGVEARPDCALYKKGDRADPANYRGVTLMVVAAKVLERVVLARVRRDRERRARESQAGFRVGRSCADQVFSLRRVLEERRERGLPTVAVALDFSAAYDSVDRESLWRVLAAEGMGPRTLALLRELGGETESAVRVGRR